MTPVALVGRYGRKIVSVGRSESAAPSAPGAPFSHSGIVCGSPVPCVCAKHRAAPAAMIRRRSIGLLPFYVIEEQIACFTPEAFAGDRTGGRKVDISSGCGIEFGPPRQRATVGIAGLGEVRPVLLHLFGDGRID